MYRKHSMPIAAQRYRQRQDLDAFVGEVRGFFACCDPAYAPAGYFGVVNFAGLLGKGLPHVFSVLEDEIDEVRQRYRLLLVRLCGRRRRPDGFVFSSLFDLCGGQLLDLRGRANRAGQQALLALASEFLTGHEPALEAMPRSADEVENDHRVPLEADCT